MSNIKYCENSKNENFLIFWEKYPKKVCKRSAEIKFYQIKNKDLENLFIGLDLYLKKWSKEETPKKYIPNPNTWINQLRRTDEIEIYEENKKEFKKILIEDQKKKEEIQKQKEVYDQKQKFYNYWIKLSIDEQTKIKEEVKEEIKNTNKKVFEKGGILLDQYIKILIRSRIKKMLNL